MELNGQQQEVSSKQTAIGILTKPTSLGEFPDVGVERLCGSIIVIELHNQQIIGVGERLHQTDNVVMAGGVGAISCRHSILVAHSHVDASGKQQFDDVKLSLNCSVVQR